MTVSLGTKFADIYRTHPGNSKERDTMKRYDELIRAMVIGARDNGEKRNIGGETVRRLVPPLWDCRCIVRSRNYDIKENGIWVTRPHDSNDFEQFTQLLKEVRPHVVFIAIPTRDLGETALRYALASIEAGAKVVTAEKGIVSGQFARAEPYLDSIDFGASVGGSTRFLYHPKLQYLRTADDVTLYGIWNATCNFALWRVGEGLSPDDTIVLAEDRGIAEPSPPGTPRSFRNLLNGEMPDIRMKTTGAYNKLVAPDSRYLIPGDFGQVFLDERNVGRLLDPHYKRRLLVTIKKGPIKSPRNIVAPMRVQRGDWHLEIGFVTVGSSPIADWLGRVKDIDNGFLLYVDGHRYEDSGPGAGRATVDAMMEGAYRVLDIRP